MEMRSAWLKWARAVEHQRVLSRGIREYLAGEPWEYVRWDNAGDLTDPLVRMQWRLKIKRPLPEAWGVLLGDVLTNLRAALDHTMWTAVLNHSGPPAKPNQVQFPVATRAVSFNDAARKLKSLVSPEVWAVIESLQPFHGGDRAHTAPLEIVRWLSNMDKHRSLRFVVFSSVDLLPVHVQSDPPVDVIEERRQEGPVEGDNKTLLSVKIKRPAGSGPIDVVPTFGLSPSIQISEDPVEFRPLASAMPIMTDTVLKVVSYVTGALDLPMPDVGGLELGDEHELAAAELGGNTYTFRDAEGTVHRFDLSALAERESEFDS
ncbi:hypothetical protein [Amycolatopsis sp. NPDC004378]